MSNWVAQIADLPPAPWIKVPAPLQARFCWPNKTVVIWDEEAGLHVELSYPLKRQHLAAAIEELRREGRHHRLLAAAEAARAEFFQNIAPEGDAEYQMKSTSYRLGGDTA